VTCAKHLRLSGLVVEKKVAGGVNGPGDRSLARHAEGISAAETARARAFGSERNEYPSSQPKSIG
jgi:hypothetical protein